MKVDGWMISNLEKVYYCGRVGMEIWSDGAKYDGEYKNGRVEKI